MRFLVAVLIAAGAWLISSAEAKTHPASWCSVTTGKTLEANTKARVYQGPRAVYGCNLKTHRRLLLINEPSPQSSGSFIGYDKIVLRGSVVAFSVSISADPDYSGGWVGAADISRGKILWKTKDKESFAAEELAVSAKGVLAFTDVEGLHTLNATGLHVIDEGKEIHAIAIAGSTLYWTNGTGFRTASL